MQHHAIVLHRNGIDVRERGAYPNAALGRLLSSDIQRKRFWPHSAGKSMDTSAFLPLLQAATLSPVGVTAHPASIRILSTQSLEKSPRLTPARYAAWLAFWLRNLFSRSDAISCGITTMPAPSATMTSPGFTTIPPQQMG